MVPPFMENEQYAMKMLNKLYTQSGPKTKLVKVIFSNMTALNTMVYFHINAYLRVILRNVLCMNPDHNDDEKHFSENISKVYMLVCLIWLSLNDCCKK